jgi:hypothetical protein
MTTEELKAFYEANPESWIVCVKSPNQHQAQTHLRSLLS